MAKIQEDKMVKKARRKFVLGATAATFAAVLMLVMAINLVRYVQVRKQQEETLLSLSGNEAAGPQGEDDFAAYPHEGDGRPPKEVVEYSGEYDDWQPEDDGDDGWEDDEDDEDDVLEQRIKSGRGAGHMGGRGNAFMQFGGRYYEIAVASDGTVDLKTRNPDAMTGEQAGDLVKEILEEGKDAGYRDDYRYLVRSNSDGTTVVSLLDCTMDKKSLTDLMVITSVVGFLGTLIAFFFILYTSRIAVKPLAESMEKQKRFITDAGHELKTPLSVISTNMDILTMDLGENEWVEGTQKQVGRLRKLVNNLVSLSKMDEQDTAFEMALFPISDAAFECADLYQSVAESAGKRLEADIEEGVNVTADENSIRQIFSILLDNAVKYAEGDGVIRMRLHREGRKVFFETENDWAHNVDAAKLDTLFDRFTRGDRSRSGANGKNGFGLGLAIARAAADKNNASLTASETEEGRLRFTLCLHA